MKRLGSTLTFILLMCSITLFAQERYEVLPNAKVTIEGTSTLHAWESIVEKTSGVALARLTPDGLEGIDAVSVKFEVKSIKSGKDLMDKLTYKALKAESYPYIQFDLNAIQAITPSDNGYLIKANGELDIAGVKKPISMDVVAKATPTGSLNFTGQHTIDMTDHEVDPPTAMFGTIKTGKDITLKFDLNLSTTTMLTTHPNK